ncbi:hypothetical protein D3C87_124970 [compost metagenome]
MPITTGKGYKLPQNGERGSWWQNLIDNWVRMDGHKHDGLDSQLLDARNIQKTTQVIQTANWVPADHGLFRQEITLPTNITFAKLAPTFLIDGGDLDGALIHPTIEKSAANKYNIFVNDNTLSLKVIYA